jgi:hypothetical protein
MYQKETELTAVARGDSVQTGVTQSMSGRTIAILDIFCRDNAQERFRIKLLSASHMFVLDP